MDKTIHIHIVIRIGRMSNWWSEHAEQEAIKECLQQIEIKLGWGESDQWHNEVFTELSDRIQLETDVLLSPTTLKRVWGKVNYNNAPSISTLIALSQFAGQPNWRAFKNSLHIEPTQRLHFKYSTKNSILVISGAVISIVVISLFVMSGPEKNILSEDAYASIKFSSQPVTEGLPNSVIFKFDLPDIKSDSIFIQQFWDPNRTVKISAEQKKATGIYYYPGYFRSKLLIEGQLIRGHDLYLKSGGWLGTLDYNPVPKYITQDKILHETLSFPQDIIDEIHSSKDPIYSTFHFVDQWGQISGDDFSLDVSIKNTYNEKWAVCQKTLIYLLGSKGAMIIPFCISGCVSDIGVMLNDVYINGKTNDLTALATNLSEIRNIGILVDNKRVHVSIDGNEVYSSRYHEPMGDLVGVLNF